MQLFADPGAFGERWGAGAGRAGAEVTQGGEGCTTAHRFDELPSGGYRPAERSLALGMGRGRVSVRLVCSGRVGSGRVNSSPATACGTGRGKSRLGQEGHGEPFGKNCYGGTGKYRLVA